jgi:hypothetical protein
MTIEQAIKHANEVAEENQAIVDSCDYYGENMAKCEECAKEHRQLAEWLTELKLLREQMSHSEKPNKWIPLTKRPMTKEEREEYEGMTGITETMILNCPLPEDGEEVFVSYGGYVCVDTFHDDDGCYFEDVEIDEVEAWMSLPSPYKAESEE